MDGLTFEVFGNRAILDNLDTLDETLQAEVQAKLEQAGQIGLEYADEHAPVKTGYLRSRNELYVEPGEVTISNDAEYAIPVILGHRTRSGSYVPANDFLTPGMLAGADWLKEELRGII